MSIIEPLERTLQLQPWAHASVFEEAFDASGQPRPAWRGFVEAARQVTIEELARRSDQAEELLRENGVTYQVLQEGTQSQRPWQLDLLPVLFSLEEWQQLERGLSQRARLLQRIVRDCHGPRRLLAEGLIPAEFLFSNPGYHREFCGLCPGEGPSITLYAAEIAREPSGAWRVMADRAEAPAGAGFALENRIVTSRTIPLAMHREPIQRLAPFFVRMQETLRKLGRQSDNTRIVLLSPGPQSPYYFEDIYLARYLGYTLVEGGDLAVRDDRVYLKTLAGLIPVDLIFVRGPERGIDPLEIGNGGAHGVPGLLHAIRTGTVVVANSPGSGLIESPIFMSVLPELCRQLLGEELLIPSIPTWWCGDLKQFDVVRARFAELVIKPAFQASGGEEMIVGQLTAPEQQRLLEKVASQPHDYVAQELISRSAAPSFRDRRLRIGHVAIRTFLTSDGGEDYTIMPGGLVRVASSTEPMELAISAGVGSKDLWVQAQAPVKQVTLLAVEDRPIPLRRTSAVFPSRVADDLFWLGQSLDRADFLARMLRAVVDRLTAESSADTPELPALVRALADQGQIEAGFAIEPFTSQLPALAEDLPRMVGDPNEPRGLAAAVSELMRLASLERLWMSPDTWRKIQETAQAFQASTASGWTGLVDVLNAVNQIVLDIAAVSGLIHDGMVRSPAWRLFDIGRRIERSRDVAKLLCSVFSDSPPVDRPLLKGILEVIDCRMAYRARYLDNLRLNAVLDLCITDETCPRSIAAQVVALSEHVEVLPHDLNDPLRTEEKRIVMAAVHSMRMISAEELEEDPPASVIVKLAEIDHDMRNLSDFLTRKYLLHSGVPRQINSDPELPR